ncbi:MAG: hypothetical protein WBB01_21730 [Phormidesmis sp.]
MQTLMVNMPQALRAQLQDYQNDRGIAQPAEAIVAVLQAYFETWEPATSPDPLPAMYDAEDGPCEVISSFLET